MKHLMIMLINIYQKLPLSMHNACRFTPTCSNYAKEAYIKYGFFYGSYPVTEKEKKRKKKK